MIYEKDGLFKDSFSGGREYKTTVEKPALKTLCNSINKNDEVIGLLDRVGGDIGSRYEKNYSTRFIFGVLSFTKILLINLVHCLDLEIKEKGVLRKTILNGAITGDALKERIDKLPLDTTAKDVRDCFINDRGFYFFNNTIEKYKIGKIYLNPSVIWNIIYVLENAGPDDCSVEIVQNAIEEIDEVLTTMINSGSYYDGGSITAEYSLSKCFTNYENQIRKQVIRELKEAGAMEDRVLMACDPELVGLVDELASYAVLTHNYARTLTSCSRNDALIRDAFKEAGFVKYTKYQQVTVQGKRLRNIYYDPLRFNGEPSLWQIGFYLNKSVGVNHKVGEAEAMADNTQTLTINRPKQQENKIITVGNKKAYQVGKGDYQHRNGVIKEEKAEMNKMYTYPVGDKDILSDLEDLLNNIIDNPDTVDELVNYLAKNSPAAHFISEMIGCSEIDDEESLIGALNKATSVSQGMVAAGKNVHIQGGEYKVYNYLNVDYPKPIFGREFSLKQLSFCFDVAAREIEDIFVEAKAEEEAEEVIADAAQAQAKEIEDILDGVEAEEEKEEVITHDAVQNYDGYSVEELEKLLEERRKKAAEQAAELKRKEELKKRKALIDELCALDKLIEEQDKQLAEYDKGE